GFFASVARLWWREDNCSRTSGSNVSTPGKCTAIRPALGGCRMRFSIALDCEAMFGSGPDKTSTTSKPDIIPDRGKALRSSEAFTSFATLLLLEECIDPPAGIPIDRNGRTAN